MVSSGTGDPRSLREKALSFPGAQGDGTEKHGAASAKPRRRHHRATYGVRPCAPGTLRLGSTWGTAIWGRGPTTIPFKAPGKQKKKAIVRGENQVKYGRKRDLSSRALIHVCRAARSTPDI